MDGGYQNRRHIRKIVARIRELDGLVVNSIPQYRAVRAQIPIANVLLWPNSATLSGSAPPTSR